jgi:hypothetical protein
MKVPTFALALLIPAATSAQYYQTDFPAEEFKARHARVFEQIGANAVAVVQGVSQTRGVYASAATQHARTGLLG